MSTLVHDEMTHFMSEFRALMVQFDRPKLTPEHMAALQGKLEALAKKADSLCRSVRTLKSHHGERVADALDRFRVLVGQQTLNLHKAGQQKAAELNRLKAPLAERYEHVLDVLRNTPRFEAIARSLRTLRPTNYWRNIFHACMGISGVFVYEYLTISRSATLITLASVLVTYIALDKARHLHPKVNAFIYGKLFGLISRPREQYQTPAAIWYVAGLMFAVAVADKTHAQLASLVLGIADPAASLVGKRWGKLKLFRDRSLLGTSTFVAVGVLGSSLFLMAYSGLNAFESAATALVASTAGAAAELISGERLDDNLSIPVAIALALSFVTWAGMLAT